MKIGTVRKEEARVFDSEAGLHQYVGMNTEPYGSFEVFWWNGEKGSEFKPGWYWHSCFPGCIPDSDPVGPFASSTQARLDADENWEGV